MARCWAVSLPVKSVALNRTNIWRVAVRPLGERTGKHRKVIRVAGKSRTGLWIGIAGAVVLIVIIVFAVTRCGGGGGGGGGY